MSIKKLKVRSIVLLLSIMCFVNNTYAQATGESMDNKMNDFLRSSNKLFAVIAILATIFTIIIIYLVYQDLKIKKLEKEFKNKYSKN